MGVIIPEGYINIPRIIKILGRTFHAHTNALEYLGFERKPLGNSFIYPIECVEALKTFYKENPNTKTFFFHKSCMEKYGEIHPSKVERIKEKKRETVKKHFGVEYPAQSKIVKQKMVETNMKKYGVSCSLHNRDIHEAIIKNNREKYGCDNPMQNKGVQDKLFNANVEKYGNRCSLHGINQQNTVQNRLESQKRDKAELEKIYGTLYTFAELADIFDKDLTTISLDVKNLGLNKIEGKTFYINQSDYDKLKEYFYTTTNAVFSNVEKEMAEFISSIYSGGVLYNDRTVLCPKELDIYIPEKKVAIEFDGIYWHSELPLIRNAIFTKESKEYTRIKHLEKTLACEKLGIRLIHIFEDEWVHKKDICKSIIASALGIYKERIYARKCEVREIDKNLYNSFMDCNHIQGSAKTHFRFGLFYDNRLVQCMGFVKNAHKTGELELNRMATLLDTQVLGGFSKLLKSAVNTYNFATVYSYISRRLYNGQGYRAIGFIPVFTNEPTYFYVKNAMRRFPRYEFQRRKIEQKYNEGKLKYWNPEETEEENMYKNGYGKIWDCGTIKVCYFPVRKE